MICHLVTSYGKIARLQSTSGKPPHGQSADVALHCWGGECSDQAGVRRVHVKAMVGMHASSNFAVILVVQLGWSCRQTTV